MVRHDDARAAAGSAPAPRRRARTPSTSSGDACEPVRDGAPPGEARHQRAPARVASTRIRLKTTSAHTPYAVVSTPDQQAAHRWILGQGARSLPRRPHSVNWFWLC